MTEFARAQIDSVLKRALELPDDERARFLDETVGRDPALGRVVLRMLRDCENDDESLLQPGRGASGPVWEALARDYSAAFVFEPGERLGAYRVARVLGRGGMATVYLAERADGQFEQTVALKVLDMSRDFDGLAVRFAQERQILARLEHPNIARLIDGGSTRSGQPYVVMEFIDGQPIDSYCDRRKLTIDQRIKLFSKVADAVQYAHGHLIVHRDIKPSNILVTDSGEPKLLDFGIAKLLDPGSAAPVTRSAIHPMTPEYASPEQVRGEPLTTGSDVYQLGFLLYHLLTGRSPYSSDRRNVAAMVQAICNVEPLPPSAVVVLPPGRTKEDADFQLETSIARGTTVDRLQRQLAGDLDNILLTALQKEPARRYTSVFQLCEDLRRYLDGLPVSARRATAGYRARKFIRRNAAGVAAAVLVAISLAAGSGVALWQAQEKAQEAAHAEAVTAFVLSLFEQIDPEVSQGEPMTVIELLEQGSVRVDQALKGQPGTQADLYRILGNVFVRTGAHERGIEELERALALQEARFGRSHPTVADLQADLGHAHARNADFAEASRFYRQALALREALFGRKHESVASSLTSLGDALIYDDRVEGERLLREALALRQEIYGSEHPGIAATLEKLAGLLEVKGDLDEAEAHYREAVRQERIFLEPDHSHRASTLGALAALLAKRGKYTEAEAMAREALVIRQRVYGGDHPLVASSLSSLAAVLHNQARFDEAATHYRQALSIRRDRLGDENVTVAHGHLSLAASLHAKGDYAEAEASAGEALAIFSRLLGDNHLWVAITLQVRGGLLFELDRLDEAQTDLVRARDLTREIWGDEHFQMANVLVDYGKVLMARRRLPEAEAALRSAVDLRRKQYGPVSLFVADPMALLGRCLVERGQLAEAEPLLLESYPVLAAEVGLDYKETRNARRALRDLYTAWDKPTQAAQYE
jgi:serine/threonine-protein kinase